MLRSYMANVKHVINNDVIQWLDTTESSEAELVFDPELNRMLNSIRTTRPVRLKCGASECETTIAYWGLSSGFEARVIPGPKRQPRGKRSAGTCRNEPGSLLLEETYIIGGAADLDFGDFKWEQRLDIAIEYAEQPGGKIRSEPNPDVGSGWPLRWEFVCPRKTPEGIFPTFQYTNSEMLRMFARTVGFGQDTIRPDRLW